MDKGIIQTAAIIFTVVSTVFSSTLFLSAEIKANSTAILELRQDMREFHEDIRELRGLMIKHISGGHNHQVVAADTTDENVQ